MRFRLRRKKSEPLLKEERETLLKKLTPCFGKMQEFSNTFKKIDACSKTCPVFVACSEESIKSAADQIEKAIKEIPDPFVKKMLKESVGKTIQSIAKEVLLENLARKKSQAQMGQDP